MASPNQIVTVNVSVSAAPLPSTLQQTGAEISQGATTLGANARALITQPSDLTALLTADLGVATISWSGNVVTVTTSAPLPAWLTDGGLYGVEFTTTLEGFTPAGYNGQVQATSTGASGFTFPLAVDPGTETVLGTYTITDELVSMVDTFFAQGSQQSVYVLELGSASASANMTNLETYITNNPGFFYSYLVPRSWDQGTNSGAPMAALLALFEATNAKTYFFITSSPTTYTKYTAQQKDAFVLVEAPGLPLTEFSCAAPFWVSLSYRPSGTNRVTPFAFSFLFGVTPYPLQNNGPLLTAIKTAGANVVGTGAEGGLTNTVLFWGTTMDLKDFTFWYGVDWTQINLEISLANEIINGSNEPINPLYYNQAGINRLQTVATSVLQEGITDGMLTGDLVQTELDSTTFLQNLDNAVYAGDCVVNAIPFLTYTLANPSDFPAGKYAGLSAVALISRGFVQIIFNLNVTQFLSQ